MPTYMILGKGSEESRVFLSDLRWAEGPVGDYFKALSALRGGGSV